MEMLFHNQWIDYRDVQTIALVLGAAAAVGATGWLGRWMNRFRASMEAMKQLIDAQMTHNGGSSALDLIHQAARDITSIKDSQSREEKRIEKLEHGQALQQGDIAAVRSDMQKQVLTLAMLPCQTGEKPEACP